MSEPENALEGIHGTIKDALLAVLSENDFDIATDQDAQSLAVSTDDWTLHIELKPDLAGWFAVDDEPDDIFEFPGVLRAVLGEDTACALGEANAQLDNLIVSSLRSSADPISLSLATVTSLATPAD